MAREASTTRRRVSLVRQRPGSPFWYANFSVRGRRFRHSLETDDRDLAETIAARQRADALLGKDAAARRTGTLSEAFGVYWIEVGQHLAAPRTIRYWSELLLKGLGRETRLDRIEPREIARYIARRRAAVANASVNREVELLRRVLRRAEGVTGLTVAMPDWKALLLPEADPNERILTAAEETRLFDQLRPDLHAMVRFALITGQRLENVYGLGWHEVDWEAATLRLRVKSRRPGGKIHMVPLPRAALAILSAEKGRHPLRVFTYVCQRGRWDRYAKQRQIKGHRYPYSRNGWRKPWLDAIAAAKIPPLRFHDLRHTAATRTLNASGNLKIVQRLLGHANIATTARYLRAQVDDVRAALEATARGSTARSRQKMARRMGSAAGALGVFPRR